MPMTATKPWKRLTLFFAALLVVSLLPGCQWLTQGGPDGPNGSDSEDSVEEGGEYREYEELEGYFDNREPVEFRLMIDSADPETETPHLLEMLEEFQWQYPHVTVESVWTAPDEHELKLLIMVATSELPDLFRTQYRTVSRLADYGVLLDLEELLEQDEEEIWDQFRPGMLTAMRFQGAVYGLPSEIETMGLWYNPDILRRYGWELPEEIGDYRDSAQELESGLPLIALSADRSATGVFQNLFHRAGFFYSIDDIMDGSDDWSDDRDFLAMFEWIDRLEGAGAFPEEVAEMSLEDARELFFSEGAAMLDGGSRDIAALENSPLRDKVQFTWGPYLEDGLPNQETTMITAAHPFAAAKPYENEPLVTEAVYDFLRLYYGDVGSQILMDHASAIPVTDYALQVDEAAHPVYAAMLGHLEDEGSSPVVGPVDYLPEKLADAVRESVGQLVSGEATPQRVLSALDRAQQDYLEEQE